MMITTVYTSKVTFVLSTTRRFAGLNLAQALINNNNIKKLFQVLLNCRPKFVRGHPQAIEHLVTLLQNNKLDGWQPTAVTTASEALYDFQA